MILISDTGGTSSNWVLIEAGQVIDQWKTTGYNPVSHHADGLQTICHGLEARFGKYDIEAIYYYGTGIINLDIVQSIEDAFTLIFSNAKVQVVSDLIGAVRATCGEAKGIVAISGTGSNVCQFDGQKIESFTPSLGYPLGDEGSGSDIGQRLIKAYYYHDLPNEVNVHLANKLPANRATFLMDIKNQKAPNQYFAGFAPDVFHFFEEENMMAIIQDSMNALFKHHICKYDANLPLHFVGGVAHQCSSLLRDIATSHGYTAGKILSDPMSGLIDYHTKQEKHV